MKVKIILFIGLLISASVAYSQSSEELVHAGLALDSSGNYDKAIKKYDKAIQIKPLSAE
ncbi:MAG: tetratricopeptide repeat protein, partial [Bacteroidia bacterium]|nr:tetratricopeptide repeat protein [Bacteroidia bacterium]